MHILNTKEFAYTSDSDVNSSEKAKLMSTLIEERDILPDLDSVYDVENLHHEVLIPKSTFKTAIKKGELPNSAISVHNHQIIIFKNSLKLKIICFFK